jgi:hypothetical protein
MIYNLRVLKPGPPVSLLPTPQPLMLMPCHAIRLSLGHAIGSAVCSLMFYVVPVRSIAVLMPIFIPVRILLDIRDDRLMAPWW